MASGYRQHNDGPIYQNTQHIDRGQYQRPSSGGRTGPPGASGAPRDLPSGAPERRAPGPSGTTGGRAGPPVPRSGPPGYATSGHATSGEARGHATSRPGPAGSGPRHVAGSRDHVPGSRDHVATSYGHVDVDGVRVPPGGVGNARAKWERQSSESDEGPLVQSAQRLEEEHQEGRLPQRGIVRKASKEWRVHEDGALAHRLQNQENEQHYGHNRSERHLVREDIINAKIVQHEEELRLQEEKMREIEEKKRLAERDAAYVQRLLSEEEDEEDRLRRIAEEDERLAREMMREVSLDEEEQLEAQQAEDERVAIELQRREERRYERYKEKKKERELDRARKKLEKEIEEQRKQVLPAEPDTGEGRAPVDRRRLSSETGVVEDTDFTDFYHVDPALDDSAKRTEQERQDAELARLLQDQEHKRGGKPNKDKMKTIEERDAELANIINQQEKLRAEKREKRMRQHRYIKSQSDTRAASSLTVDTAVVGSDVIAPVTDPSLPRYSSPPNYQQAVSRSRDNLDQSETRLVSRDHISDQSGARYGSRDSMGQSPPAYQSPQIPRARDSRINQSGSNDGLADLNRSYDSQSPTRRQDRHNQSASSIDYNGRVLNRSFERPQDDISVGRKVLGVPVLPNESRTLNTSLDSRDAPKPKISPNDFRTDDTRGETRGYHVETDSRHNFKTARDSREDYNYRVALPPRDSRDEIRETSRTPRDDANQSGRSMPSRDHTTNQSGRSVPSRDSYHVDQSARTMPAREHADQSASRVPSRDSYNLDQSARSMLSRDSVHLGQSARTMPPGSQSRPSEIRHSYPQRTLTENSNFKTSQSAYAVSNILPNTTDQLALRTSQTMQQVVPRDRPVSQSRKVPVREELRRAVDHHVDSDSDEAGFEESVQMRVQGHPNSRTNPRPYSTPSGAFNIVAALDPTYRPGATQSAAYCKNNPGQDCHQYLRNQFSTLEYGDSSHAYPGYESEGDGDGGDEADDWMPVQGQRRQSAGKSSKKRPVSAAASDKDKDKCKQQ